MLVVLLVGLGHYFLLHLDDFRVIAQVSWQMMLLLALLHGFLLLLSALQFYFVAREFDLQMPFASWLKVFVFARCLNRFCPQAGNAYRVAELKITHKFPISAYVGSFASFSYLNRLLTLVFVFVTIVFFQPSLELAGINVAIALGLIILVACLFIVCLQLMQKRQGGIFGRWAERFSQLAKVSDNVVTSLRNWRILSWLFVLGLLSFILSLYSNWLCFKALGVSLGIAELGILKFAKSTTDSVSLTPGNVGVTETLYGVLSKGINSSVSIGIIAGAILNIAAVLAVLLMSGLLLVGGLFSLSAQAKGAKAVGNGGQ